MKKNLLRVTLLLAVLTISIGISYATWTPGTAPTSNVIPTPITAIEIDQIKPGSLSVNTFAALGSGRLKQDALFAGKLNAVGTDPNLKFRIGGTNSDKKTVNVDTTVSGNVISGKTLGASELRNTTLNPLCADSAGHIIFCSGSSQPPVVIGNDLHPACLGPDPLYSTSTSITTGTYLYLNQELTQPYDATKIGDENGNLYNMVGNRVTTPKGVSC